MFSTQIRREEMVHEMSPKVRQLARRFFLQGADRDDLIQEGMLGLAHAINTYKPEVGKEFGDYASMCIRNALLRAVRTSTRKKHLVLTQAGAYDEVNPARNSLDPSRHVVSRMMLSEVLGKLRKNLSASEYDSLIARASGSSLEEIGRRHKISNKQVENALFRARRKARALAS